MIAPGSEPADQAAPNLRRAAIATVSLLILCQSFQGLITGGVALFLPRIREDLDLSFTQAGSLSAVSTLVYALMQIPAGFMADRFGPRKLFFIGAMGTNVFGFTFGLISSYGVAL
ncbi:MAG: MFS transporter, partial [Tepidiformaceae bacterium]